MTTTDDPDTSSKQRKSVFRRGESVLAHYVYGLILTMATLGELILHDEPADVAVLWLLGTGAVLLAAHLFSDILAHVASTLDDPDWSEIMHIGRHDVSVAGGAIGAALIMAIAALADLDSDSALILCVGLGLIALAALTMYATSHHRWLTRVLMSVGAVGLSSLIVVLENAV